nr:sensor histidine kinase [Kineosporia rhizophila]
MIVLNSLPVLVRRQSPAVALGLCFVLLFGLSELDADIYSTIPGPGVLCAYALADRYGRRVALACAPVGAAVTIVILQVYSPHVLFSWSTVQNLALVFLPLALGVAAHDRRAWTAALLERAQAAERNQEEITRRRVSEERLRIARDVHDVVAHALVTINVQAGVGAYLVKTDPEEAHSALRTIKQVSGDALTDLRSTLGLLRETTETPAPPVQGIAALGELADGLRTAGVDLTVDVDPATHSLPTPVDSTAYRIVQESLTNTLKHAGPTTARITISHEQDRVQIEITDDGGTPAEQQLSTSGSGNGLRGMRERAAAIGGSLQAGPRPGGGWQVVASLPLTASVEVPAK